MYSPPRLAQKYLRYYFTAANGKGHGIHSPFVFDFVTKVLNDRTRYDAYQPIEQLRRRLLNDQTQLPITDLGAGSAFTSTAAATTAIAIDEAATPTTHTRSIASIARRAAKPRRLGQLLHRVARHYQPKTILELGTSLGLSTAYLASGAPNATTYTIEGAPFIAKAAQNNLEALNIPAKIITGSFDEVLPGLLNTLPPIDLAFVDGNHRREPTLRYFEELLKHVTNTSILIFDDIHWSAEMEAAWAAIKTDPRVAMAIDVFFFGFVIFSSDFKVRQDFVIRF